MENNVTVFEIIYEGDLIPIHIKTTEDNDIDLYVVSINGYPDFEIFLSEDDMWVTNDEVDLEEDFIYLIGDKFESLQP